MFLTSNYGGISSSFYNIFRMIEYRPEDASRLSKTSSVAASLVDVGSRLEEHLRARQICYSALPAPVYIY